MATAGIVLAQATALFRSKMCKLKALEKSADEDEWLERQLLLVDLWIAVSGVFGTEAHSMRHRLRKNVASSHAFLQILQALNKNAELRKSMAHPQSLHSLLMSPRSLPKDDRLMGSYRSI